jgi:hypothetical protein
VQHSTHRWITGSVDVGPEAEDTDELAAASPEDLEVVVMLLDEDVELKQEESPEL